MSSKPAINGYNDLALKLARVKAQIHSIMDAAGYPISDDGLSSADKAAKQKLSSQRDSIQKQLDAATPQSIYTPQQAEAAYNAAVTIRLKKDELVRKGVAANDPALLKLADEFKAQNTIYNQYKQDQTGLDTLKTNADTYVKQQNANVDAKKKVTDQASKDKANLAELQRKRAIEHSFGLDTSALDKQIAAINGKSIGVSPEAAAANDHGDGQGTIVPPVANPKGNGGGQGTPPAENAIISKVGPAGEHSGSQIDAIGGGATAIPAAQKAFINKYGGVAALSTSLPWMAGLVHQAITGRWDAARFNVELNKLPEWQQLGRSGQLVDSLFFATPGHEAWIQQYNDKVDSMRKSAIAQGYDPNSFGQKLAVNASQSDIAAAFNGNGAINLYMRANQGNEMPQSMFDQFVAQHASLTKLSQQGTPEGAAAAAALDLKRYAQSMGINPNVLPTQWTGAAGAGKATGDWFSSATDAVAQGLTTLDSLQSGFRSRAAQMYKPFATEINNGASVVDLASNHLGMASNLLEKPIDNFTLGDHTGVNGVITNAVVNGTPLDQFATQIKQTPDWLLTGNARNSLMDTAVPFLQGMGMMF